MSKRTPLDIATIGTFCERLVRRRNNVPVLLRQLYDVAKAIMCDYSDESSLLLCVHSNQVISDMVNLGRKNGGLF